LESLQVSIRIEIPDDLEIERIDDSRLPSDWQRMDNPALRDFGSSRLTSGRTVALDVPSAAVKGERNVLLIRITRNSIGSRNSKPNHFSLKRGCFKSL
jgi:hypothetical protein